jgi:hypothetical protein
MLLNGMGLGFKVEESLRGFGERSVFTQFLWDNTHGRKFLAHGCYAPYKPQNFIVIINIFKKNLNSPENKR